MSKTKFKKLVKEKCIEKGFEYLNRKKRGQEKIKQYTYKINEMQKYLKHGNKMSKDEMKFTYLVRTKNLDLKSNFGHRFKDKKCPIINCKNEDTQEHLFSGICLPQSDRRPTLNYTKIEYSDLFKDDIERIKKVSNMINVNFKRRKQILSSYKKTLRIQRTPTPLGSGGQDH